MEKNKTGKYFKYAVGEIILVVIGILIALQVNDWNQNHKLKSLEIEILNDFKSSLLIDMKDYNNTIKRGNNAKNSMDIILTHLENDLPYSDSLKFHFGNITDTWTTGINRSVFESLKSEGREEKTELLTEMKEFLESVSLTEKSRQESEQAESAQQVLNKAPLGIYIG